jgi:hypothetical protein
MLTFWQCFRIVEPHMTKLLEEVFAEATKLPEGEQDAFARLMLGELHSESEWNQRFHATADKLSRLAKAAIDEFRSGRTEELDPDRL